VVERVVGWYLPWWVERRAEERRLLAAGAVRTD
jgi:hypothetical protein